MPRLSVPIVDPSEPAAPLTRAVSRAIAILATDATHPEIRADQAASRHDPPENPALAPGAHALEGNPGESCCLASRSAGISEWVGAGQEGAEQGEVVHDGYSRCS